MELARTSPEQPQLSRAQIVVLEALADGQSYTTIAKKIAKGDPKVAKAWRQRIKNWIATDPTFQQQLAVAGKVEGMVLTVPVVQAIGRRALRGRVDAARLIFELSGFHNPKVQHNHEHSGTIDINLKMGGRPEPVVDADVVEE